MEKKRYKIGIIPGDGIGRDVIKAAKIVIKAVQEVSEQFTLDLLEMDTGGEAVKKYGNPFPQETIEGISRQMPCCLVRPALPIRQKCSMDSRTDSIYTQRYVRSNRYPESVLSARRRI